ncbi:glycosyltransferase family 4 protein [Candidatus Parcubacteria bacterium]|nr:glycosyltransferase family 4 protein [Candidatus Parcubacteria bacterium]
MNTAISEALATGLPVVATKHSGFQEQVIDGKNGYLANVGNPEDIANKLLLYISHPERWSEMSANARAHVLAHYDKKVLIEEQVRWYKKLAEARGHE